MKRIAVFLVILFILTAMIGCTRPSPPVVPSSVEPPAQTETSIPAQPTTPTPTTLNQTPQKVFFGSLGIVFWQLDSEGKRSVAYILGFFDTPGPGEVNHYCFPLAIEKDLEGRNMGVIGTIPDPNIEEIGRVWETVVNDAEQNVVCKVRLTRVREAYKYKIEFFVSPDGGKQWFPPSTFPPD